MDIVATPVKVGVTGNLWGGAMVSCPHVILKDRVQYFLTERAKINMLSLVPNKYQDLLFDCQFGRLKCNTR